MLRIILICLVTVMCFVLIIYLVRPNLLTENNRGTKINDINEPIGHNDESIVHLDKLEKVHNPVKAVEPKYKYDEFQAGMNLLVYGHPKMSYAPTLFKRLRQLGVNSVAIVFPFNQEDWQADIVTISSEMTPTMAEINDLIVAAKKEGLSVMIRPILDEESIMKSGHWRGTIKPKDIESWFESYRSLLLKYAELAETTRVEIFNIGTEFNSLQNNSKEWSRIIKEIREVYQGKLIYSFNWDTASDIGTIEFVSLLDYIGLDAYFPLDAPDDANVVMLEEAWEERVSDLKNTLSNQPIIITEAGMIPVKGAYRNPYEWSIRGGTLDPQAQANYYEATYNTWKPVTEGIYWWCVTLSEQNPNVIDYSPLRSPTESMIKQFYLR